jgi:hypothetical protein
LASQLERLADLNDNSHCQSSVYLQRSTELGHSEHFCAKYSKFKFYFNFSDSRKRKKNIHIDGSLWTDDMYKRLRVQALEADLREKQLKHDLLQNEEDRKKSEFDAKLILIRAQTQESEIKAQLMKAQLRLTQLQIQNI